MLAVDEQAAPSSSSDAVMADIGFAEPAQLPGESLIGKQVGDFLETFREEGTTQSQLHRMLDFETQNAIVGLPEMLERARRYGS